MRLETVLPTKQLVIEVLEGLLSGRYDRTEVVAWWNTVCDVHALRGPGTLLVPLGNAEGYWEFVSLSALLLPARDDGRDGAHFIRNTDVSEWLAYLTCSGEPLEKGLVHRHRWPSSLDQDDCLLLSMNDPDGLLFSSMGIKPVRGLVNDLGLPTEFALVDWQGQRLWLERCCDDYPRIGLVSIHGSLVGAGQAVASLLATIGVSPGQLDWVSPELEDGPWALAQLDDSGNELAVIEYASFVEARLWQAQLERSGARQASLLRRA